MTFPSATAAPLHVVDATMFWSPTGGGVRRYLQTKHAWLARQPGWRHSIAVPRLAAGSAASGNPANTDVCAILPSWPLPGSGGYRLPLARGRIASAIAALEPDLVEAGDPYRVAWGALDAARRRGAAAVAYCHSDLEMMARLAGGRRLGSATAAAVRRYARHLYRHFDLVLAPSQSMRNRLLDWGIAGAECQPLGVDTAVFHPSRRSPVWRAAQGWTRDDRILVYAGRFAAEKHLDVLAAAVRALGAPYVLLAVGAGPMPPLAGDRVRVVPFVAGTAELATVLASADAFVHAGDQETFGLSVLEAMACGTPVVARRAAGLAEMVDASVGIAVDGSTPACYAAAIHALFGATDPGALRAAARARAERHDWERVLPALLERYARLIGARTAPGASAIRPAGSVDPEVPPGDVAPGRPAG